MKSYPKKIQAAILVRQNSSLVIDEISLPQKLLKGQVLVKMFYSGICGSQLGEISGVKGKDKYLPHLLGHEGVGEVIDYGYKVSKVKKGDKILLHWMPASGLSSEYPKYTWKNKIVNAGSIATFNSYAVVSENKITKISKKIKNQKEILMLGCTASTAIGSVNKLAKMKKNQTVAISGCGALGLSIIKVCKIGGAKNIIVIDINEKNISLAKKFGATFYINNAKFDFKKIILNKFPNLIDHFFECTGDVKIISDAYECLNSTGNEILIGVPRFKQKACIYTLDLHLGKNLIGCKGGNFQPDKDLNNYLKIINKSEYQLKKHITNEVELRDINDVFSDMRKNKLAGKCIINLM